MPDGKEDVIIGDYLLCNDGCQVRVLIIVKDFELQLLAVDSTCSIDLVNSNLHPIFLVLTHSRTITGHGANYGKFDCIGSETYC